MKNVSPRAKRLVEALLRESPEPLTGFDFFDMEGEEPPPEPPAAAALRSLKRDDRFRVKGSPVVFRVTNDVDNFTKVVVKDGTAGRKYYVLRAIDRDNNVEIKQGAGGTMDTTGESIVPPGPVEPVK